MRSSYAQNDFGHLIWTYMVNLRPVNAVELGVLDGYSTLHIARGFKDCLRLYQIKGWFHAYDLFEDYPHKHGDKAEVQKLLDENEVQDFVELRKGDAFEVHKNYENDSLEFLHIDISNTGQVIKDLLPLWHPKMRGRGILCIEGGSEERDNVEWMKKYNHPSLKQEISTNPILNKYYIYGTYFRFPSMTVGMRKWYNE